MDIPTPEQLVAHYEGFCRRHGMAETRFGREATGEPQLIQSIRGGRSPSLKLLRAVAEFMAAQDSRLSAEANESATGKSDEISDSQSPGPAAEHLSGDGELMLALEAPLAEVAACGECAARPGSAEAKACTRSDCGLALRSAA